MDRRFGDCQVAVAPHNDKEGSGQTSENADWFSCYTVLVLKSVRTKLKISNLLPGFCSEIGVDLGSSNTYVFLKDRGVVVEEPTCLAQPRRKRWTGLTAPKSQDLTPIAYGYKAKEMVSREPKQIEVISPIERGVIADLGACEKLISYYLKLIHEIPSKYPKVLKPRVVLGVPGNINRVQKRAFAGVLERAGAGEVTLVETSVLAALGLGMTVDKSNGLLVVDIGGGKTEVSLISMGGVVLSRTISVGGSDLDETIINFIKMKYGMLIGRNTAERIKIDVGRAGAGAEDEHKFAVVRGRDLESGLPKSIKVSEAEVSEALLLSLSKIIKLIKEVLDETPPELMEDVLKRGIMMVGNGSRLKGLSRMVEMETKINTRLVADCGLCVIKGCGALVENADLKKRIKLVSGV